MSKLRPPTSSFRPMAEAGLPLRPRPAVAPAPPRPLAPPPPVTAAPPRNLLNSGNPLQTLALALCSIYLFIQFSFIHEILIIRFNLSLYLPLIFGTLAAVAFIAGGGLPRAFSLTPVRLFTLFSLVLVAVVPFSSWPGGSVPVLSGFFRTQWVFVLLVSGLIFTLRDIRWILYSTVSAGLLNVYAAFFLAKDGDGRLELEAIVTMGNSNDLAAQLLMIVPFFWAVFRLNQSPRLLRWLCILFIPLSLLACLRTASRGALVAMAIGYVFLLIHARGIQRFGFALAVPALFVILFAFTPGTVTNRLRTLLEDNEQSLEAVESRMGRTELMKRAFNLTLQNPLTGVGPGQFSTVEGFSSRAAGQRGIWMQAHNTYLQISSEAGLLAAGLLLATLIYCYRIASRIRQRAIRLRNRDYEVIAMGLMLSIIMFSVAAFFLTLGYRFYFPYLIGFSAALYTAARRDLPETVTPPAYLQRTPVAKPSFAT